MNDKHDIYRREKNSIFSQYEEASHALDSIYEHMSVEAFEAMRIALIEWRDDELGALEAQYEDA